MYEIKYAVTEPMCVTVYITDCITKEINYGQ